MKRTSHNLEKKYGKKKNKLSDQKTLIQKVCTLVWKILGTEIKIGYTFGSRLYGNASCTSDFDFLVVLPDRVRLEGFDPDKIQREGANLKSMEWFYDVGWFPGTAEVRESFRNEKFVLFNCDEWDAWIVTSDAFEKMIQHAIPLGIECLSLEIALNNQCLHPIENNWGACPFVFPTQSTSKLRKGTKQPKATIKDFPAFEKKTIYRSFGEVAKSHWLLVHLQLANYQTHPSFRMSRDTYHSIQKRMFHALRVLKYGLQVVTHGHITDFREAVNLYSQVVHSEDLPHTAVLLEKYRKYGLQLLDLMDALRAACGGEDRISMMFIPDTRSEIADVKFCLAASEQAMRFVTDKDDMYRLSLVNKAWYNFVHDRQLIKDLCIFHNGRKSCGKFFACLNHTFYDDDLSENDSEQEELEDDFNWFMCFKIHSWRRKFSQVALYVFVLLKTHSQGSAYCKNDGRKHSDSSWSTLLQGYDLSHSFHHKKYRGKFMLLTCVVEAGGKYDRCTYYDKWGMMEASQLDQLLPKLPKGKDRCFICDTKGVYDVESIFGRKISLCCNGHLFGCMKTQESSEDDMSD